MMTSKPLPVRPLGPSPSLTALQQEQNKHSTQHRATDVERTFPPNSQRSFSSLPHSYEIPTLRPRTERKHSNAEHERHNRSVSHSLSGFLGGRKERKNDAVHDSHTHELGTRTHSKANPSSQVRGGLPSSYSYRTSESKSSTGTCMTCASTVRWPQGLKAFRCTTCLTVNDLEPASEHAATSEWPNRCRKPVTISLDRTRRLIHLCIDNYLRQQLEEAPSPSDLNEDAPKSTDEGGRNVINSNTDHELSSSLSANASLSNLSKPDTRVRVSEGRTNNQPTHALPASDPRPDPSEASFSIFRAVESYISSSFSGCSALNASFFSIRSANGETDKPDRRHQPVHLSPAPRPSPLVIEDSFLSELDAKTLLLGDVAENGAWWMGRSLPDADHLPSERERSPERWRGIVSAKSPRINWYEVNEWYNIIHWAGYDWQSRWQNLGSVQEGASLQKWNSIPISRIQLAIHDSKVHLQRVLLKSTENLLKRPRRPLQSPEDARFLLILLANPLLFSPQQRSPPTKFGLSEHTSTQRHKHALSRRNGVLGHHTGILKRILGLLSNLSNENHQFLVSWMSRFSDSHFQRLVDIVGMFFTYRLSKQQDRSIAEPVNPTDGLVPSLSNAGETHASQLHAALSLQSSGSGKKGKENKPKLGVYSEDWQVKAAARLMSLLFQANIGHISRKRELAMTGQQGLRSVDLDDKFHAYSHGQILPINAFYNLMLDHADLVADFEAWEKTKSKFTFCQYPFFLSIWAKIHIMEHDARRQMEVKAREAFFDSILSRRAVSQFLVLKVRRECLVDDSLKGVSQVVGSGANDIKKGLRIDFVGEEGVDAGGLRKEWFLLLVREIFDPQHGLFLYDEDSGYCYFNPFCFESSEQFFLVGVLLGLAIYNSTILDVAFPPFVFRKMLASAPSTGDKLTSTPRITHAYTLEDLAEYRPILARGLRQLLEFEGDVQETFCRDFVLEMDKYGETVQIPLCANGQNKPVTNANRREFVDLYVRYLLDTAVTRQYEPFKRGFFSVCGGNALSLFQPEEIELLVRGSDERLDVASLRAVATYDNWPKDAGPPETQPQVLWFWQTFEQAEPSEQRKLLSFITGSDRIPAMGATNLTIRIQCIRDRETEVSGCEVERFPMARTCFNTINLYRYLQKDTLEKKLWTAVRESEGFGLK